MSDRLIPLLGASALLLATVYLGLVVTTISFATWQTQGVAQIRETEGAIADLEAKYYESIARINSTDPSTYGLGAPVAVRYVAEVTGSTVTFAGR